MQKRKAEENSSMYDDALGEGDFIVLAMDHTHSVSIVEY